MRVVHICNRTTCYGTWQTQLQRNKNQKNTAISVKQSNVTEILYDVRTKISKNVMISAWYRTTWWCWSSCWLYCCVRLLLLLFLILLFPLLFLVSWGLSRKYCNPNYPSNEEWLQGPVKSNAQPTKNYRFESAIDQFFSDPAINSPQHVSPLMPWTESQNPYPSCQ